ncbi:YTH domain-containing protein ECT1-like isoform X2 [Mangifera indica]|nr:YTH domain-containing protein ECT1-like isoform X2 [Mangifera indica]XP_044500029.1 YTH domain-containing protein ECT1-like isoform X2 [Mangifera indica]
MYHQGYGYSPCGIYPSAGDGQLQGLQQYQYPSPYYPPYAPQGVGSTSVTAETNKGSFGAVANGSSVNGNNGSKPLKPSYQNSNIDPNGSYRRGGLSTAVPSSYHDPRYSFDGIHSPTAWYDSLVFSSGVQSKHAANAGFNPSHSNGGRNQNHHSQLHLTNLHHARPTSGFSETYDYMNPLFVNNTMYGHYGNTYRTGSGFGSFGYDSWMGGRGWYTVDSKYKPRGCTYGASGSGKENGDGLNELNKGPRAKGFKNQEGFDPITLAVKGQNLTSTQSKVKDSPPVVLDKEKYNGEDFPVESYVDAKFYVIKSYSEDDVHKSVKYNMWTSTPNGNKKLDAAYREAKEKSSDCPVFLLFSVNASGQFVGLAEMAGPVDFDKTVEYWQQDKWIGCFPLKWHIIKDIPNSSLRHITLENNENKPVTNSRDTQEVNFEQGIEILKIFKSHLSKRCILDDFGFYESREKILQEKKAKQNQLPKEVLDGKPDKVVIVKDNVQKSVDEASIKDTVVTTATPVEAANGKMTKLEEDKSVAAVEDAANKGSKSAVTSCGKTGSPNGVASAC